MTTPPEPTRLRRCTTRAITSSVVAIALLAGCTTVDRPAIGDWTTRWNAAQDLVPTQAQIADGGRQYCDQLVGELRTRLPDLEPTPDESIDAALDTWSDHLRTLAFECPSDPTVIGEALSTIDSLESEIDAAMP